jgi:tripartite-type tricarboxylate transporter receptor subunit TctC
MKLQTEAAKALAAPDLLERYSASGLEPIGSTPEQFGTYIRSEVDKWTKVVRAAGVRVE